MVPLTPQTVPGIVNKLRCSEISLGSIIARKVTSNIVFSVGISLACYYKGMKLFTHGYS